MTVLVTLTAQALVVGNQTLGPWATPAGNGLRVRISRSSLPSGALLNATPWFSFDNQATWVRQFSVSLVGGVFLEKDGTTPVPFTTVESPWQRTAAGALIVPTHIKCDAQTLQNFTAASIVVETT
jgi:hypothetical protein